MLVLLVIFIITAPLMASSLKLDLPKADAPTSSEAPALVALAIDSEGRLYLGEQLLDGAQAQTLISTRVRDAARRDPATEVQLRADSRVPYGRVAEMMGLLQKAGLTKVALAVQPPAPKIQASDIHCSAVSIHGVDSLVNLKNSQANNKTNKTIGKCRSSGCNLPKD